MALHYVKKKMKTKINWSCQTLANYLFFELGMFAYFVYVKHSKNK